MKTGFYPKLALDGIKKNKRLYLPYLMTCSGVVMMFYIIYYLASMPLSIPAGGSSSAKFDITAPEGLDTMGIKMVFISDTPAGRISDGIFVTVPVYAPEQTVIFGLEYCNQLMLFQ